MRKTRYQRWFRRVYVYVTVVIGTAMLTCGLAAVLIYLSFFGSAPG